MKKVLLDILVCPQCKQSLACTITALNDKGDIESGQLTCQECHAVYPIIKAIPRFVEVSNYADSFGYQWNKYKRTQIDRYEKHAGSRQRFASETSWGSHKMQSQQWMLEVGCGNGRFLDIARETNLQVVGLDMSNAVDAAYELLNENSNVHLVQASIYEAPFREKTFDYCYSIGVIQHTPNPEKTIRNIAALVKPDGHLAVTLYERKKWTYLNTKYWVRPITKKINKKVLLAMLQVVNPILFPLTNFLYRVPRVGKVFQFFIPYANYVHFKTSLKNRYSLAILDTFDMLSPMYDQPQRQGDVERYLRESQIVNIKRLANPGLNLVGQKVV
jgi:2-polyprenyl-3-methyl-5-hydroxy-6-metoxy-1,4-benzoquinol methylase